MAVLQNSPRTRRSAKDRRDEIMAAAKARFAIAGFDGTSTRQIADDLGVAQSLLLYHFKNKEEIWKAVMTQMFERSLAIQQEEFGQAEMKEPRELLRTAIRTIIRLSQDEPDLHRIMTIEGRSKTSRLEWLADAYLKRSHKLLTRLISECQTNGDARQGDPTLFYYNMVSMAGSSFSFTPEMALLSPASLPVDTQAIEEIICATLFYDQPKR
jgi:AcrR family transcriptional regulator